MADKYLDALIAELEDPGPTQDSEDPQEEAAVPLLVLPDQVPGRAEHDPGPGDNQQHQDDGADLGPVVDVVSPVRQSPILAKYLSSSSARRRIQKVAHCNYCNSDNDRASLGLHLQQNERCMTLYSRRLHVKTVDAVLCLLYECLFCEDRVPRLFNHLEHSEDCRLQYMRKFNVDSSRSAVDKVIKLKRTSYKSRRSLSRAVENENAKKRKVIEMKNEPEETFLNMHTNKNLFSNFRTCVSCQCNLTVGEEVTIDSDCVRSGAVSLENKDYLKRFGNFYICKHCDADAAQSFEVVPPQTVMKVLQDDDKFVFLPKQNDDLEDEEDQHNGQVDNLKKVSLMFPCSTEALKSVKVGDNMKSLTSYQIQHLLYRNDPFDRNTAGLIYQHQLLKYKKAKDSGDLYSGKIVNGQNQARTLTGVKMCSQESKVVGSEGWRRSQISDLVWKRKQLGRACLKVRVTFPFDDPQTLATSLVQRGSVVTATLRGGETGELDKDYFVHTGHDSSTPCINDCPRILLTEYLNRDEVNLNPDIATYVSSVDQLINSFITNVFKSPSSRFQTECFHFNISFDKDGQVLMEGLTWPLCFHDINLVPFDHTITDEKREELKAEFLDVVRKNISSSSNVRIIKSQFSLSEAEANSLHQLVVKHQIHVCKLDDCDRCRNAPLPSLECKYKQFPESPENISSCKRFLRCLKGVLDSLPVETLKTKATIEWLQEVWEQIEISELVEPTLWRFTFESQDFYFRVDGQLRELMEKYDDEPIAALYQYCIGLGEVGEVDEIVMKRLNLLDCFTNSFVPFYLRAANSSIKIEVLTSSDGFQDWSLDRPNYLSCYDAGLNSHVKIHLTEAHSLIDSKKLRTRSSNITEFVYTGSSSSVLLKKVSQNNENCLQAEGDGFFYEVQQTAVTRYCQRVNGKDILLSEVVCFYDYAGKEQSAAKFEVFHDKLDKIPTSEVPAVLGEERLPELILCQNKDVLQIRKKPKVLIYQTHDEDTYEHKFGQVLLFSAVNRFEDLTPESVEEIFEKVDEETGKNVVKANKRRFYQTLLETTGGY